MTKLILDNSYCAVQSENAGVHKCIRDALSYQVPNWENIKRAMIRKQPRNPYWRHYDGIESMYNLKHAMFLSGLLPKVVSFLREVGVGYGLVDKRTRPGSTPALPSEVVLGNITLRDYQARAVREFLGQGRGIAQIATGGGKTEIAIALTKLLGLPTLFLTHRINLLYQTAERFAQRLPDIKRLIGIIGDGVYDPKFVTVASTATLLSMIKKHPEMCADLLGHFQFLIIDEAHRSGAKSFYEPASLCRNAFYRLGLTATPFMKGSAQDDMYLQGVTGDVVTKVSYGELIELGYLAQPFFKFFEVNSPSGISKLSKWHDVYEAGIVKNAYRNQVIVSQAKKLVTMERKVLVIVTSVAHGKLLKRHLDAEDIKNEFLDGQTPYSQRAAALKWLAKGHRDVIVATNIFDEGIDCKEIDAVILAAGGKSVPALYQRIGRASRKKAGENYSIIMDFIDNQHRMLRRHSLQRHEIIKQETGFKIL